MSMRRRHFLLGCTGFGAALLSNAWVVHANRDRQVVLDHKSGNNSGHNFNHNSGHKLSLNPYDNLRFVAIADTGTGGTGQYAVASAMNNLYRQNPYSLVLMAGDNIYNRGEIKKVVDVFEKPYAELITAGVEFRAVLGNHDIMTNNGRDQLNYKPFNMLWRYYTFRKGPVQFFGLDTNANADWERQLEWLEQGLKRAIAPWKVVFAHHPIYSAGQHGNNAKLRDKLAPMFAQYGVQLYLSGHDHNYERSHPIDGTTYIVHGAGDNTRGIGQAEHTAYAADRLSFVALEATRTSLQIAAVGTNSEVFDYVGISNIDLAQTNTQALDTTALTLN